MSDVYSYLNAAKGLAYKSEQIKNYSLIKVYPEVDTTRELRGNSRIIGDADKSVQDKIIDMLITISARYLLNYKEIAYILLTTKVESGFNPDAAAGTTSAAGLAQATAAFVSDAKSKSLNALGFTLDIENEKIFNAEKGCYAVIYSFLINKAKVLQYYSVNQRDYWKWLYLLHHDGINSLAGYSAGTHKISKDGDKWADYILERLPTVETLLKSTTVKTTFKLSTDDGTPVVGKNYIAVISRRVDSTCPNLVSGKNDPLIFIKGVIDSEGKTAEINALAGAEIIFTILKDNYQKLAISDSAISSEKKQEKSKKKAIPLNSKSNSTYAVKSGDTLSNIAKVNGTTVDKIAKLNNLTNVNVLHIGQILKLTEDSSSDTENSTNRNYISRYVPTDIKQAILKYLGFEQGNAKAAMSYSRSHIVLPVGSISTNTDKNKNVVHLKTTTKPETVKTRQKPPEKHQTDDKGTAKSTIVSIDFEPKIIFIKGQLDENRVSEKSKKIIKAIAKEAGVHIVHITSTLRTAEEQAQAMYTNMCNKGVASQLEYYGRNGRVVINAGVNAGVGNRHAALTAMINKIKELQGDNKIVSRHCVSESMYAVTNVMDISKTKLNSHGRNFDKAIINYMKKSQAVKYISPYANSGEPAFHLEIEQ